MFMKRSRPLTLAFAISGLASVCVAAAPGTGDPTTAPPTPAVSTPQKVPVSKAERLLTDTATTTVEGNSFIAPAGWTITTRGPATTLEAPEGDSHIAFVDVRAPDADAAVAAAWQAYKPDAQWPLKVVNDSPDQDGWTDRRTYTYETSPNEKRYVDVLLQRANDVWTAVVYDMTEAVGDKRLAQVALIYGELLPKGYTRESFAGRRGAQLDAAKLAGLHKFVESSMKTLGIPGVAVGIVQDGKVVLAEGYGVRQLGRSEKVDTETLFMIGSNTKALTTLLLAKLVDEKKISWETPVTNLLPSFRLGSADTTRQVKVKHLICACTGLPRQDMEMIFEYAGQTPADALDTLASMQPTSAFGEMFQYSNPLAAAAGFVAGHVAFPQLELGAAYDKAMQTRVFDALGMKATTFNYSVVLRGNHGMPHAAGIDGATTNSLMEPNDAIIPVRPAGAAWSNVHDMLAYINMELADGLLPDGQRYVSKEPLVARRAAQVPIGKNTTYGMGLEVDTTYGTAVVHHGGATFGFLSDMMWLPEHDVGAVILTNSDTGGMLLWPFQRKLLEVLFDGRSEADALVAARGKSYLEQLAADRKSLTIPADPVESTNLASQYSNEALGIISVSSAGGATVFDFGEWRSEMASRKNADGTVSFTTITPGVSFGFEFVVGSGPGRTLIMRDAQHEYTFEEQRSSGD
jgi:CubicO group peptidase (beta-lactamase class C family)